MAFDIYTLARASCLGECTPPIPHPGLHWREVSRCCLRSRGLKCVNLSPDRASAIAGGRKCPRLPLTFQAELRMKHVGGAALATTNSWAINGYCCMPLKLWVSLSHSKSWPIQTVSVCVCVCVCWVRVRPMIFSSSQEKLGSQIVRITKISFALCQRPGWELYVHCLISSSQWPQKAGFYDYTHFISGETEVLELH